MGRKRSRIEVDYRFVPIPHDLVADGRVSASAARLWCWLHILDWRHEAPDPAVLQDLMDTGQRSIYRWLKELEEGGWLVWQRNTYNLAHRFTLATTGPGGDTATVAQIRAALGREAPIEEIRAIVESADRTRETAAGNDETFVTSDKSDRSDKSVTRIKTCDPRITKIVTSDKSSLDSSLPDASDRPPSEDQNHENHVGVGVGGTPADFVHALVGRGMNAETVKVFIRRGHDLETILQSLDNAIADAADAGLDRDKTDRDRVIGNFVTHVMLAPPKKGKPYERQYRPVQSEPQAHQRERPTDARTRTNGKHGPTGGSDLHDPGWRDRLIAEAEAGDSDDST